MPLGAARLTLLAFQPTVAVEAEVIRKKVGIQAIATAQVDTAQYKFGGSSAKFADVLNEYIGSSADSFDLGSGDFTIEMWAYFTAENTRVSGFSRNTLMTKRVPGNVTAGAWGLYWDAANSNKLIWEEVTSGGGKIESSTNAISTGSWQHIAAVRSGSTITLYVDGTSVGSGTLTTDYTVAQPAYIGYWGTNFYSLDGWIDELRISNSARYTAGFTPSTTPFVNDDNTLLLLHMDGTDGSTHFDDDNGVGRAAVGLKQNGNTQIDTAQYQFGGASALFDGASDGIIAPDFPAIGTGEFTAEAWIRFTDTDGGTIFDFDEGFSSGPLLYLRSDEKIDLFYNGGGINFGSTVLSQNTWYHIALTRESDGYTRIYIDGTLDSTSSSTFTTSIGSGIRIGIYSAAAIHFAGHIDEVRISDTARYTANFTAPTAPFVNDSNTLLLLHMDGTDASTLFLDDNGTQGRGDAVVVTAVNQAQIDTAQYKFGGSSALFDGASDYLVTGAPVIPSTGDFTIEFWVRMTDLDTAYFGGQFTGGSAGRFNIAYNNSTDKFQVFWNSGGDVTDSTSTGWSTNTWYHFAVSRDGDNLRLFIDGALEATTTGISGATMHQDEFWIGGLNGQSFWTSGNIDEFRISNSARYTAAFTPSTEPFTNDANTLMLLHMNGADGSTTFLDDCGRSRKAIQANGSIALDTAQSEYGGASLLLSGSTDYLVTSGDTNNGMSLDSGEFTIEGWVRIPSGGILRFAGIFDDSTNNNKGFEFSAALTSDQLFFRSASSETPSATNPTTRLSTSAGMSADTWHHIAAVGNGTNLKMFCDGTKIYDNTFAIIDVPAGNYYEIGRARSLSSGFTSTPAYSTAGSQIDEYRLSNVARYTADFTPSTTPFQNDANTLLLLHMDGTDGNTDFVDDNGKESA